MATSAGMKIVRLVVVVELRVAVPSEVGTVVEAANVVVLAIVVLVEPCEETLVGGTPIGGGTVAGGGTVTDVTAIPHGLFSSPGPVPSVPVPATVVQAAPGDAAGHNWTL
mmetsp:Transcript_36403/g.96793  ORF Transcript_36403/g.96793 Transcript_36403/m.96793 type:complete len:110 (-) Transcript_36403:42-371(-)